MNSIIIETNKSIRFDNLVSFRKKMNLSEVSQEVENLVNFLKEKNENKIGPMISATYGMEQQGQEKIIDIEYLIPIGKKIDLFGEYKFKKVFHLVNALYTRYIGNPANIQVIYNEIAKYIQEHQLQQITPLYSIKVSDNEDISEEEPIIDIYIGLNPSIL
jgi:effector-binding domain-containing protein